MENKIAVAALSAKMIAQIKTELGTSFSYNAERKGFGRVQTEVRDQDLREAEFKMTFVFIIQSLLSQNDGIKKRPSHPFAITKIVTPKSVKKCSGMTAYIFAYSLS